MILKLKTSTPDILVSLAAFSRSSTYSRFYFEDFCHIIKVEAQQPQRSYTQCLKITENVAFNIASEASYVYILSTVKQCYQTGHFKWDKNSWKIRHLGWFSNTVSNKKKLKFLRAFFTSFDVVFFPSFSNCYELSR